MKKHTYAFLAAIAACGFAQAAETAYTTPVGYVSLGNPAGPAVDVETDQTISLPVKNAAVFQGAISGSTASTVTFAGTPLGDYVTTPHVVEILGGPKTGVQGLITANTSSELTVSPVDGVDFSSLGTATAVIRPATTVASLMAGASSVPAGTQFHAYSGTVPGIYLSSDVILEWDGANWIDIVNTGEPADSTVIYPGENFIIRNNSTEDAITSIVATGEVVVGQLRMSLTNLDGDSDPETDEVQDFQISYASSVPETVADSGISSIANSGDQINITDSSLTGIYKAASFILEYDGSNWIDIVNTGEPAEESTYIGGGFGFTYRRNAIATPAVWTQSPTYIPTL